MEFIEEEAPAFTIKQMIYDLMDLCFLDATKDPEREEYSENTMSFLASIEELIEELGANA